jgi:hypothetical protein
MGTDDDSSRSPDILRSEDLPNDPDLSDHDFFPDRESWLDRIILPANSAGIPMSILVAFGLGMLSASHLGLLLVLFLQIPFTCGGNQGLDDVVFFSGVPVHPAALAAGLLAGGARRAGAPAARFAVLSGTLGTLLCGYCGVLLWGTAQC